jgi:hypothetical protein
MVLVFDRINQTTIDVQKYYEKERTKNDHLYAQEKASMTVHLLPNVSFNFGATDPTSSPSPSSPSSSPSTSIAPTTDEDVTGGLVANGDGTAGPPKLSDGNPEATTPPAPVAGAATVGLVLLAVVLPLAALAATAAAPDAVD